MKKLLIVGIFFVCLVGVILFLYKENNNNVTLKYEILNEVGSIKGTKNGYVRDYEIIEKNNEYYLIIYGGEQPTTDTLEVLSVKSNQKNVEIEVRINPGFGDAFSYPKAIIKFDKEPKKISIIYK